MTRINRSNYQDYDFFVLIPMTYPTYNKKAVRNFTIFENWRKGMTYKEIGKKYNLCKEAIRQIILGQCHRYDCIKYPLEKPEPSVNLDLILDLFPEKIRWR